MTVKIMIERDFKETPKTEDIRIINELRIKAMAQEGYVGGETLIQTEDDRKIAVVSVWSSLDDWKRWAGSHYRRELEAKLASRLERPTTIKYYMLAADCLREILTKAVKGSKVAV